MDKLTIWVEITGGLANQLFQWAAAESLASKHDAAVVIDCRVVDRPWERGPQLSSILPDLALSRPSPAVRHAWATAHRLGRYPRAAAKRLVDVLPRAGSVQRSLDSADAALSRGNSVRLRGLFQDAGRAWQAREFIGPIVRAGLAAYLEDVEMPHGRYAAVHVRRGDYVAVPEYRERFGVCTASYFRTAISKLDKTLPIWVSSDDRAWVDEEFSDLSDRLRVFRGTDQFADLGLLAGAEQLVMSNSTFSWWASYIGEPTLVICPQPWFTNPLDDQHLERPDWLQIDRG